MNEAFFLKNLWLWKCEMKEISSDAEAISYEDLKESEWSVEFEQLMRNRLILGAIRYGKLHAKNKPSYNRIESCFKRLEKYNQTGNKEFLVDVANLCLLEFEECNHPLGHFSAIDDGEHVKQKS